MWFTVMWFTLTPTVILSMCLKARESTEHTNMSKVVCSAQKYDMNVHRLQSASISLPSHQVQILCKGAHFWHSSKPAECRWNFSLNSLMENSWYLTLLIKSMMPLFFSFFISLPLLHSLCYTPLAEDNNSVWYWPELIPLCP